MRHGWKRPIGIQRSKSSSQGFILNCGAGRRTLRSRAYLQEKPESWKMTILQPQSKDSRNTSTGPLLPTQATLKHSFCSYSDCEGPSPLEHIVRGQSRAGSRNGVLNSMVKQPMLPDPQVRLAASTSLHHKPDSTSSEGSRPQV